MDAEKTGVYILKCKNLRYYIGSTNNLERRLKEHRASKVKATRNILPIELVFFQSSKTLREARNLEYRLKAKKSRKIIENIIRDGIIKFHRAVDQLS